MLHAESLGVSWDIEHEMHVQRVGIRGEGFAGKLIGLDVEYVATGFAFKHGDYFLVGGQLEQVVLVVNLDFYSHVLHHILNHFVL